MTLIHFLHRQYNWGKRWGRMWLCLSSDNAMGFAISDTKVSSPETMDWGENILVGKPLPKNLDTLRRNAGLPQSKLMCVDARELHKKLQHGRRNRYLVCGIWNLGFRTIKIWGLPCQSKTNSRKWLTTIEATTHLWSVLKKNKLEEGFVSGRWTRMFGKKEMRRSWLEGNPTAIKNLQKIPGQRKTCVKQYPLPTFQDCSPYLSSPQQKSANEWKIITLWQR